MNEKLCTVYQGRMRLWKRRRKTELCTSRPDGSPHPNTRHRARQYSRGRVSTFPLCMLRSSSIFLQQGGTFKTAWYEICKVKQGRMLIMDECHHSLLSECSTSSDRIWTCMSYLGVPGDRGPGSSGHGRRRAESCGFDPKSWNGLYSSRVLFYRRGDVCTFWFLF